VCVCVCVCVLCERMKESVCVQWRARTASKCSALASPKVHPHVMSLYAYVINTVSRNRCYMCVCARARAREREDALLYDVGGIVS